VTYKNAIKIQRAKMKYILTKVIKNNREYNKRDDSNSECCSVPFFCSVSISSRGSGPLISRIASRMWPAARVCEGGVEEDERWVKIVAKVELPNLR
jgi:hypothetical protein